MRGEPCHDVFVFGRVVGGGANHHAALRPAAPGVGQHRVSQQFLDGVAYAVGGLERFFRKRAVARFIPRHGLAEQVLLGSEGRIKPSRGQARRRHQIRHRRAFIPLFPERQHGLLKR
ncbi:hypothetical protein G6F59_017824 [Rhizopus arrhizus]|nr:hypothetical protein G6F59_017824 [Rhizopus arrhizus]